MDRPHLAIALLKSIMRTHQEPDNLNYNKCDKFPCEWCLKAQEIIGIGIWPTKPVVTLNNKML
jgi:hypothetical protein